MRKKPSKPKAKGPAYFVKRIKHKINQQGIIFSEHLENLRRLDKGLVKKRTYYDYNIIFKPALGMPIAKALAQIPRGKGKPLTILEDGAGYGNASAELKYELNELKIPSKIIVLSLRKEPKLMEKKRAGLIDEVVIGLAEKFVPKNR